jgi:hypothetical protein
MRLKEVGAFTEETVSDDLPTLGYYIARVREAAKKLRLGSISPNVIDADQNRNLHKFFTENGFLVIYRDRESHGDEKKRVTDAQYLKCRKAALVDNLFGTIVSLN